jgi:glycosyltransferase involved in cell wall biosynthesis
MRAVNSLLAQTYREFSVVVVNDGDRDSPWDQLASIRDPRLIRFDLMRNHGGPFFAYAVVVEATACEWFLVQEQDDWSEPDRLKRLMDLAFATGADVAVSAQYFHQQSSGGGFSCVGRKWCNVGRVVCPICGGARNCQRCFIDVALTPKFRHRAPHNALFKSAILKKMGGYYAGFRLHYDSLLMNYVLMLGRIAHTRVPLYHRLLRPDSLTQGPRGFGSRISTEERRCMAELYRESFARYQLYLQGRLSSEDLARSIRHSCRKRLSAEEKNELAYEAARLRTLLPMARH